LDLTAGHPLVSHGTAHSRIVNALRGIRQQTTPVWFMRQAGRSLPEYRALRKTGDMLEACLTPTLSSEITMQPVRRHGVDAAIFFSDIVVPLKLVGLDVSIVPGRGPVFGTAADSAATISAITAIDPQRLIARGDEIRAGVATTVEMLGEESGRVGRPIPLIGFAGAPFTLAAYLVEGGPSKDHLAARRLMFEDPAAWRELLEWAAQVTGRFLTLQVEAGASAAQLFDSWAGALSVDTYRQHSKWASELALEPVKSLRIPGASPSASHVPIIHFGVGTGDLIADMADIGVDAIGVDYRTTLTEAVTKVGRPITVQGNLDPAMLFAPAGTLEDAVQRTLEDGRSAPAHIFNLGHGVPQDTDPDVLTRIVELVHRWRAPGGVE
jgi:uroporphyrinogen decarboxylase